MNKGFTIIELLIVIIIMSVLTTIITSIVLKANSELSFSRTVNAFSQDLSRAQHLSLSSDQYTAPDGKIQAIAGYGVYLDLSHSQQYILYADKAPGNRKFDSGDYVVETTDFSQTDPGVVIKGIDGISSDDVSINFNSSNITTTITPSPGPQGVAIIFSIGLDPLKTRSVSINTAGLIDVK